MINGLHHAINDYNTLIQFHSLTYTQIHRHKTHTKINVFLFKRWVFFIFPSSVLYLVELKSRREKKKSVQISIGHTLINQKERDRMTCLCMQMKAKQWWFLVFYFVPPPVLRIFQGNEISRTNKPKFKMSNEGERERERDREIFDLIIVFSKLIEEWCAYVCKRAWRYVFLWSRLASTRIINYSGIISAFFFLTPYLSIFSSTSSLQIFSSFISFFHPITLRFIQI